MTEPRKKLTPDQFEIDASGRLMVDLGGIDEAIANAPAEPLLPEEAIKISIEVT